MSKGTEWSRLDAAYAHIRRWCWARTSAGVVLGALAGGVVGLVTAVVLIVLGPAVWVGVLGYERAVFPEPFPALYSVAGAFGTMFLVSALDRSAQGAEDRQRFAVMSDGV